MASMLRTTVDMSQLKLLLVQQSGEKRTYSAVKVVKGIWWIDGEKSWVVSLSDPARLAG